MKTNYFLLVSFLFIKCFTAQVAVNEGGQGPLAGQLPSVVEEKFRKDHSGITPVWSMEDKFYVADFTDTNLFKGVSIVYDKKGNVMRRESELENSTYPQAINNYFVKNYPGEKFKTWKSTDDKGVQRYCIKRASGPLWFDKEGNYIDPEKKNEQTAATN